MKETINDTIAAIATAQGEGGIGIIRISGPDALSIALSLFRTQGKVQERYFHFGGITAVNGEPIDNGFLVYMKGPRSYTGEDVVELQCHGGPLILRDVLSALLTAGARTALPGEFTKRAFLNGKLDLAQAESVIDLIRAQTALALSSARGRLEGGFSKRIAALKEPLVNLLVRIEAELDFSEEEIDALPRDEINSALSGAQETMRRLLSTFDEGRALKEGVRVLILGRPNAGKSSLLNVLLQEERAIVTPVPGTTRDIIEEVLNIRGVPVRLMDTAGLRECGDEAEAIGVRLAKGRIADASIIIYVVDLSGGFSEDLELLAGIEREKVIIAANKADIASTNAAEARATFAGYDSAFISALKEEGLEELKDIIFRRAAGKANADAAPGELVASVRHRDCLVKCAEALSRAADALSNGLPKELLAADVREAIDSLGEITGETTTEDILDVIFSTFCIGK